ncbi:MAG: hypothetical protein ACI9HG_001507 [Flavobacteriales bacterium]|jgi:hypothetical protein
MHAYYPRFKTIILLHFPKRQFTQQTPKQSNIDSIFE